MRTLTDAWTVCALGHRHWGLAGAAGLLVHRPGVTGPEVLLQRRAPWSHHGGTWGTPGGALHLDEAAADVVLGAVLRDDHGGWAYTTVLARPVRSIEVADLTLNAESDGAAWIDLGGLSALEVHPGPAASLPQLRGLLGHPA